MSPVSFLAPEIGHIAGLLPSFEFECLIAQGVSCAVFKARQPSLDRDVAVKILPRELGADPSVRSSFLAESRAMASLSHTNLIRVYDSGEVDGMPYMVMEYVAGKSLFKSSHGKAIDPKQAVRIALSVCRGIAHAHRNGITHGDIRPANILLNPECEPKIGSFGIGAANVQSDVLAIVVMLRELLTGTPGGEPAVISDPRLAAICDDASYGGPAARCRDASALADQLERWLSTGTSRLLNTAPRPAYSTTKPALKNSKPAATPLRHPSAAWPLVKNCAIIAFLLCMIHVLWGAYQTKQATIARLQLEEDAKPKVIRVLHLERNAPSSSRVLQVPTDRSLLVGNVE